MRVVSFKADEADYERWRETAKGQGVSFSSWLRRKLNEPNADTIREFVEAEVPKKRPKGNTGPVGICIHRNRTGTWCSRCNTVVR